MAQYDFDLREYWRIIRKKKFIVIFTTIAMGLFSLIFAILSSPTPVYKTSAAVKFERTSLASGLYLQTVSMSPGDDMQTQMAIIKGYYTIELVAKQLGMIPEKVTSDEVRNNPKYIATLNRLKGMVETEQEGQSSIINITATSEDPRLAQRMANSLVSVYKEQRTYELNKRTIDARKFVEEQLKIAKEKLKNSENAVRDFREKNKLISIEGQSGVLMGQIGNYRTVYDKAVSDHQKVQAILKEIERAETQPLTSKNVFYLEEATYGYKVANDRLVQLLMDRDALLITYTENYPQVVEIRKRIHELVVSMRAQLTAQIRSLGDVIRSLKKKIDETEFQIRNLPELGLELARLERNVRVDTDVYSLLEKSYQESLIKEAEKVEDVQILKPALEPTQPVNPPKTNITAGVGTLLGLILGLVFAFLIETFDTSIGTIEEVESFLGIPVLGVVPQITEKDIKASLEEKYSGKVDPETAERASRLVSHFAPQSTIAESYRALRTNLNFACRDGNLRTIAFTSATPREGKTTSIVNLAITTAQTGQRVLLVEADLRKPVIANMFGVDQTPGLTDALLGNYEWDKAVKTIADIMMGRLNIDEVLETPGMDNLHIIPAGTIPPNPAELVNSKAIDDFLKWAKDSYDLVLIDAPPVLAATDAALLGSKADGAVIVYRVGKISRVTLRRAKQQLENVRAHVIGLVLNGIKADISPDFADYDYKYYHYYGGKEQEETLREKIMNLPGRAWTYLRKRFSKQTTAPEAAEDSEWQEKSEAEKKIDEKSEWEKEDRGIAGWKLFVLFIALITLATGVAFQMGYLNLKDLRGIYNLMQSYNPLAEKTPSRTESVKKTISRTDVQPRSATPGAAVPSTLTPQASGPATPETQPAASPKTPAPAAQGVSAAASPEGLFSIQIKAIRDYEDANGYVKSLLDNRMDAFAQRTDLGAAGTWYRIYIGRFASEDDAARYLKEKKISEKYPGSMVRRISAPSPLKGQSRS